MNDIILEIKEYPLEYNRGNTLSPIPHLHREVELIYVEKGSAGAFADKHISKLGQGDFFISFPNQVHYYETFETGKYHVLIFSADIIYGLKHMFFNQQPKHHSVHPENISGITKLLKLMRNEDGKYAETARIGLLNQIIAQLLCDFELKPRIKTDNPTLSEILNFCEQHFAEDITLEQTAQRLHLNKYHISHLINQKLGMGFSYYINTLRIDAACDLLSDTDKKISDIAGDVGFGSIRSFNRSFTKIMNTTPVKYRNLTVETK